MFRSSSLFLSAALLMASGCGQSDPSGPLIAGVEPLDLHRPELVQEGAVQSDPLRMIYATTLPIFLMPPIFEDPALVCPRLIDVSDRAAGVVDWRIEGDCEGEDGRGRYRVDGSVVVRGDRNSTTIEYRDFRYGGASTSECAARDVTAVDGIARLPFAYYGPDFDEPDDSPDDPDESMGRYEVRLHVEIFSDSADACLIEKSEFAYDVTIDRKHDHSDPAGGVGVTYDMSGRVAIHGQTRETAESGWQTAWIGAWRVSADGYGTMPGDETCEKYATGTLSLESGGDVALLEPTAPASCFDAERLACTAWSLNGAAQPEMCNFLGPSGCSAGPNAPPPWAAIILLVGGLIWQNRRRRQRA